MGNEVWRFFFFFLSGGAQNMGRKPFTFRYRPAFHMWPLCF